MILLFLALQADVLPAAKAEDNVKLYWDCVTENAISQADSSSEPAELVADAAFAACRAERETIVEVFVLARSKDPSANLDISRLVINMSLETSDKSLRQSAIHKIKIIRSKR